MNIPENKRPSLPPQWQVPTTEASSPHTSSYEQRLHKIHDQMAKREALLKKSQSRAHYSVGRIVMSEPDLKKLITPHLERHLDKMGSARKAVDDYDQTAAEISKLRALRP